MKVTELSCLCVVQGGVAVGGVTGGSNGAFSDKGPVIGVLFGIYRICAGEQCRTGLNHVAKLLEIVGVGKAVMP
jgi:hypothetical protein